MKIDYDALRSTYLTLLSEKHQNSEGLLQLLDASAQRVASSRTSLVDRFATGEQYGHLVFGCFKERMGNGHYVQKKIGPQAKSAHGSSVDVIARDELGSVAVGRGEFKALVCATTDRRLNVLEPYFFLAFDDFQGDLRKRSHTDYVLSVPDQEKHEVLGILKKDPALMIDIFRTIFPAYDRSNGKLRLAENKVFDAGALKFVE